MNVEKYALSAYYPYISEVEIWRIQKVLAEIQPGDQDWSWQSQFRWLEEARQDRLTDLTTEILTEGLERPLVLGPDGRLWDGHHRLYVLYHQGYRYVPVEILPKGLGE